ncbi:hypothetical protein TNCV_2088121 [Trichonephila clavipes]|nr:hypothetical protein TNCV_2088121 [Trichonephila clavipes]
MDFRTFSLNTKRFLFWEQTKYGKHQLRRRDVRELLEKVFVLLDTPTVSSKEFATVDDDYANTAPVVVDKDFLDFV